MRTARQDGKTHTQIIDQLVEMRLREDLRTRHVLSRSGLHASSDRSTSLSVLSRLSHQRWLLSIAALNRGTREKLCALLGSWIHTRCRSRQHLGRGLFEQRLLMRTIAARLGNSRARTGCSGGVPQEFLRSGELSAASLRRSASAALDMMGSSRTASTAATKRPEPVRSRRLRPHGATGRQRGRAQRVDSFRSGVQCTNRSPS